MAYGDISSEREEADPIESRKSTLFIAFGVFLLICNAIETCLPHF